MWYATFSPVKTTTIATKAFISGVLKTAGTFALTFALSAIVLGFLSAKSGMFRLLEPALLGELGFHDIDVSEFRKRPRAHDDGRKLP